MAEVAELPQAPKLPMLKPRRGGLPEMCLIRPLKEAEALSLLSRLILPTTPLCAEENRFT